MCRQSSVAVSCIFHRALNCNIGDTLQASNKDICGHGGHEAASLAAPQVTISTFCLADQNWTIIVILSTSGEGRHHRQNRDVTKRFRRLVEDNVTYVQYLHVRFRGVWVTRSEYQICPSPCF